MPLPIRDGNQSLTTLSTLIVNSAHVPAHTVVSLGSQAITDIAQAVSGVELGPNSISALENISVTISAGTSITIGNVVSVTGGLTNAELRASSVTVGGSVQVSNFPATQSVTFSSPTITGSVSILNLPATQAVTFTQASVTFSSITGSVSVLNFPATQTTTFSSITGSVSVLNFPATQTVTFTQASVTFGTPVVTGSVSVLNFPSTQTIAGTVTANVDENSLLTALNLYALDGQDFPVSIKATSFDIPISGTVTVGNSVTIGSLPAISGTVTLGNSVTIGSISATVLPRWEDDNQGGNQRTVKQSTPFPVRIYGDASSTSVTFGATITNSVTVGSLPAISGTVTASISTFPRPTWTDYSGTVVTANSAVTAISTVTRSYLLAQVTTGQMFLNIGATATTLNSVYFSAGQGFAWETSVPQGLVSIISAVTGTNYVLKDG